MAVETGVGTEQVEQEPQVRFIEREFSRIVVRERDVIILTSPEDLSPDESERIRGQLKSVFQHERIIVLTNGMMLGVAQGFDE